MSVLAKEHAGSGVTVLTLDRPERRNALSLELLAAIEDAFGQLATDPEVLSVVLTGSPPVFCAGFDLTEMSDPELLQSIRDASSSYHRAVWSFPKPVVCAVNGPARAGGFDLTLLADLRFASTAASFGHPEIRFGAAPLFTPLRWIIGDGRARDLCLTGRTIDAEEAESIGLVSRVVEPEALLDEAVATAGSLGEIPAHVLALTKGYMTTTGGRDFEASFVAEHDDAFDRTLAGLTPGEDLDEIAGRVAEHRDDVGAGNGGGQGGS
ncbi:MAG: enoyl-CoA hydratase/isomerase family protein [Solirubrobacterales bacterium]